MKIFIISHFDLGRMIFGKYAFDLFIDNRSFSCDFLKERETQLDSLSSGFPRSGGGTIATDNSR